MLLHITKKELTTLNLNKKSYDTIVCMDFLIIFALGYCFRDFISYLKNLVNYQQITIDDWDTEFEEWSSDDLP